MLKSRIEKICDLVGLKPFVLLGNLTGIFPCNYVKKRVTAGGIIRRLYVVIFSASRVYMSYPRVSVNRDEYLKNLKALATMTASISFFLATATDLFISAFRHNRYVEFFNKLAIYDERVTKLGHPHRDQYIWYWIVLGLLFGFVYRVSKDIFFDEPDWKLSAWEALIIVWQSVIYRTVLLRYVLLVHLMYQRYRHLNKSILSNVSWTRKLSPQNLKSVTSNDILFLHSTLLDASRIINDTFSLIQLFNFSSLYFTAMLDINTINGLIHPGDDSFSHQQASFLNFCLTAISTGFVTCAVCHITAKEANNTGKYMVKDEPTLIEDSTAMDRVRMQLYLLHNRVVFQCGEFFAICLPIFFTMLVSSLTWSALLPKPYWNGFMSK